jgi:hypothetical protein
VALSTAGGGPGEVALTPHAGASQPFAGIGVDATWQLEVPKEAHPFDLGTIADVKLTIEYTALPSVAYRLLVLSQLQRPRRASRPFSLRNQFAESWFELHNPEHAATPMSVRFSTRREDFPPNLEALTIEDVALRLVPHNGESVDVEGVRLTYAPSGGGLVAVGSSARSVDGVISSRRASGGSFRALRGLPPVGEWQLTLPEEAKGLIHADQIADVLLVVSYQGQSR